MPKKIEFVAYVQTGRTSEIAEFEDDVTEEEIIDSFNQWVCEVSYASWGEVE